MAGKGKAKRYERLIERIFSSHYQEGARQFDFMREELITHATQLQIELPKNLGDVVYSYRYRKDLPASIRATAAEADTWIILPVGKGRYRFMIVPDRPIMPSTMLAETKVPDATPGIVTMHSRKKDEQALLVKLRYNRLIDIFTGVTSYSLQNHLRTAVPDMGQVETDEIYVGVDRRGAHYVFPIQAKGGKDKHNVVQIMQDIALCADKFPHLICRAIGAQFMENDLIALFEFEKSEKGIVIVAEKHYRLVAPSELTPQELQAYGKRNLEA